MYRKTRIAGLGAAAVSSLCALLGGCATGSTSTVDRSPAGAQTVGLHGKMFGGQQPVYNASIYLYAAGNTGYGSAYPYAGGAASLLGSNVVKTDTSGGFNITGDYTCPSASTEVYLEGVAGTPDGVLADDNANITMMVALGPCGSLSSLSFITMNELTTVASAYALAPFMTGPSNVGTSSSNSVGLTNAFAAVNTLVNIQYGQVNTTSLPAGATIPVNELNTLADIMAACVNTPKGVNAGTGTPCVTLFANTTPPVNGGVAPTDTLSALMNMAKYPGQNVTTLARLATKTSPFQNILSSAPNDWTISIRYTGNSTLAAPTGVATDQAGNIWITNTSSKSVTKLSPVGAYTANYTGGSGPVAIDLAGDAWVNSSTSGSLLEVTAAGVKSTHPGTKLGTANAIAIDGTGDIWAAGTGADLDEFNATTLNSTGYTGGGLSAPKSIAITPQ